MGNGWTMRGVWVVRDTGLGGESDVLFSNESAADRYAGEKVDTVGCLPCDIRVRKQRVFDSAEDAWIAQEEAELERRCNHG